VTARAGHLETRRGEGTTLALVLTLARLNLVQHYRCRGTCDPAQPPALMEIHLHRATATGYDSSFSYRGLPLLAVSSSGIPTIRFRYGPCVLAYGSIEWIIPLPEVSASPIT
jgi:hypothetical protein